MDLFDCLENYRRELIYLAESPEQRNFIIAEFTKWYIAATEDKPNLFPAADIVPGSMGAAFKKRAKKIYTRYKISCAAATQPVKYIPNIISSRQATRLKKIFRGRNFAQARNVLIRLYKFIGINNAHLGIPPIYSGVELFGSPLNTHNSEYCSPFAIERQFGSLGSFWNYEFHKSGLYLCNPPFDEEIIERMAKKLLVMMKSKFRITVLITIPVWDRQSQRKLGLKDYGRDFSGLEILKKNPYLTHWEILDKFKYPYYNYYSDRKAPASWTHFLVLSHESFDTATFLRQWRSWAVAHK